MAAILVAAACGGDNKSSSSAPVSISGKVNSHGTKDVKDGDSIEVEARRLLLRPDLHQGAGGSQDQPSSSPTKARPRTPFTIDDQKIDQKLAPDAKANVSVTLPASGVLVYYCQFHQNQGMQGALFNA